MVLRPNPSYTGPNMPYSPNNQPPGQEQPFYDGSQQESSYRAAPSAPVYNNPPYGLNEEFSTSSQPQGNYSQGGYAQPYAPPQQYPPYSSPPNEPPYPPPSAEEEARQYGTPSSAAPSPSRTDETATTEDRGILGTLAGGAAGAYAGHKMHHGFLGAMGGAYAGHKLEQMYDHHGHQKPPSPQPGAPPVPYSSHPGHQQPIGDPASRLKGNFSASAREVRLEGDFELVASVRCINGSERVSRIDLNSVLSNDNGRFRWAKEGNFAASAREIHLAPSGPPELRAELRTVDGRWVRASVRLDEEIENRDGNLKLI